MLQPFRPMEPVLAEAIPTGKNFLHQIKWDGVRIVAMVESGEVRLYTRHQKPRESIYPEITKNISNKFAEQTIVLDGEMISFHERKPDFFQVVKRDRMRDSQKIISAQNRIPVTYMVFDILHWQGQWLWDKPLSKRLELLEQVIITDEQIQITPSAEDGQMLFDWTNEHGWEGIVAKEKNGIYTPNEKNVTWKKVKHFHEIDATILGVTLKGGKVYSLLLGKQEENDFSYIGRVSSGLSQSEIQLLTKYSKELAVSHPKRITGLPKFREEEIRWFPPTMKATIRFMEWSPDGHLRSPSIIRFGI
ncbi:ATP-dependent DNA ligase [Risungbinella massiliensis]|uniref:ATP-dependent DNA ligase n=1 Tax=Risungbinella massiliensis TaxID=1329796 RepID=UPI0005CC7714|nr:RNA ligase family protein [Risungbinella massiliensis]